MTKARRKGGSGTYGFPLPIPSNTLLTDGGDPLIAYNGQYLTGEGLTVPTSIHEYMPFRLDEVFGVTVDTVADDPDNPTNWADAHTFVTDDLVAGTYAINFIVLWTYPTASQSFFLRPSVNGVPSGGFLRIEESDATNIEINPLTLVRDHPGGPLTATLQALVEAAATDATIQVSTIIVKRVD